MFQIILIVVLIIFTARFTVRMRSKFRYNNDHVIETWEVVLPILEKRYDTIQQLVEYLKKQASKVNHLDIEILSKALNKSTSIPSENINAKVIAEQQLNLSLQKVLKILELQDNNEFKLILNELNKIDKEFDSFRSEFNNAVLVNNSLGSGFSGRFFGKLFNFKHYIYLKRFKIDDIFI